jgi:hypothetical protein
MAIGETKPIMANLISLLLDFNANLSSSLRSPFLLALSSRKANLIKITNTIAGKIKSSILDGFVDKW